MSKWRDLAPDEDLPEEFDKFLRQPLGMEPDEVTPEVALDWARKMKQLHQMGHLIVSIDGTGEYRVRFSPEVRRIILRLTGGDA